MACRIINCDCKHEYQDKRYGPGRRVANTTEQSVRCTVCGKAPSVMSKAGKAAEAMKK